MDEITAKALTKKHYRETRGNDDWLRFTPEGHAISSLIGSVNLLQEHIEILSKEVIRLNSVIEKYERDGR